MEKLNKINFECEPNFHYNSDLNIFKISSLLKLKFCVKIEKKMSKQMPKIRMTKNQSS